MPVLGYWNLRGLGQPIRFVLAYLDVEYEDKQYIIGDTMENALDDWVKDKFSLGLDFPNLPYYIDGDVKLTQSMAILKYIGGKYDLLGKTAEEIRHCDIGTEVAVELHQDIFRIMMNPEASEMMKTFFVQGMQTKAKQLNTFLTGKEWVAGSNITIADFRLYETLQAVAHFKVSKGFLTDLPAINAFIGRFEELPNIKNHMESSKFVSWPYIGPFFGEQFQK